MTHAARNDELVSVVMASLNAQDTLGRALASVAQQTGSRLEVVLVDGGSSDRSVGIASSFPFVRVVRQSGSGFSGAWNEGVEAAHGDFIAFLDSDDTYTANALAVHMASLTTSGHACASVGHVRYYVEGDIPSGFRSELLIGSHLGNMPGSTMLTRSAWESVGPFPEEFGIAADIEWFARLRSSSVSIVETTEVVLHKAVRSESLSFQAEGSRAYDSSIIQVARSAILRRAERESARGLDAADER